MKTIREYAPGFACSFIMAGIIININNLMPYQLISNGVLAMLVGMILNPYLSKYKLLEKGNAFVSKKVLRVAIVLMGLSLSFTQVLNVGKYSLIVMVFTLLSAFGFGYLFGKMLGMDWKLSGLISAGTGICGASAVMAIAPSIEAKDRDIAYAISATFIFDVLMIILFPIAGRYFGMSDIGFGLWAGTAVNDTSSVVAASYAFSDAAGNYALIVKLTRTLSIVPAVLIFSYIHNRVSRDKAASNTQDSSIWTVVNNNFPKFILLFLVMVAIKSTGFIPESVSIISAKISKYAMVMVLFSIGLKTNIKEMFSAGLNPMIHGFVISAIVVVVSFGVQYAIGQF